MQIADLIEKVRDICKNKLKEELAKFYNSIMLGYICSAPNNMADNIGLSHQINSNLM